MLRYTEKFAYWYQVCETLGLAQDITPAMAKSQPCHLMSGTVGSFIVVVSSRGRELQNGYDEGM